MRSFVIYSGWVVIKFFVVMALILELIFTYALHALVCPLVSTVSYSFKFFLCLFISDRVPNSLVMRL